MIESVAMLDAQGQEQKLFSVGSPAKLQIRYRVFQPVEDAVFGFGIFTLDGIRCYGTNTRIDGFDKFNLEKDGVLTIELGSLDLVPGAYVVDLSIEQGAAGAGGLSAGYDVF